MNVIFDGVEFTQLFGTSLYLHPVTLEPYLYDDDAMWPLIDAEIDEVED